MTAAGWQGAAAGEREEEEGVPCWLARPKKEGGCAAFLRGRPGCPIGAPVWLAPHKYVPAIGIRLHFGLPLPICQRMRRRPVDNDGYPLAAMRSSSARRGQQELAVFLMQLVAFAMWRSIMLNRINHRCGIASASIETNLNIL
jgi:hypothetical protein